MILIALAAAAAAASTPAATAPANTKPKMICRSYDVTGSLVQKQRVCRSAQEWAKVEDEMQSEANRITSHTAVQPGG